MPPGRPVTRGSRCSPVQHWHRLAPARPGLLRPTPSLHLVLFGPQLEDSLTTPFPWFCVSWKADPRIGRTLKTCTAAKCNLNLNCNEAFLSLSPSVSTSVFSHSSVHVIMGRRHSPQGGLCDNKNRSSITFLITKFPN